MKREIKDGMIIEWDHEIVMDDGVITRCDVFRPIQDGKYPVILSYGPYGKGLHFSVAAPQQWKELIQQYPEVLEGTTAKYIAWETVDPEKWVPYGYIVVRCDARGTGRSDGILDPYSPRETKDIYNLIEWAASQPWSNGKVGMAGISYFAINQWLVASLQPPHLAAICPWEGAADFYRDIMYHGGILETGFSENWYKNRPLVLQHGVGKRGPIAIDGDFVCGPETLPEEELPKRRVDWLGEIRKNPLYNEFHKQRSADFSKINIPILSCGNWGAHGIHLRGNTEGYMRSSSEEKWLEIHGRAHWMVFYSNYGVELMRKFFDYYLKGVNNGWKDTPKVLLWIRYPDGKYKLRTEKDWPIPRTRWTKFYLDANNMLLSTEIPEEEGVVEYESFGEGITFMSPPLKEETEITGPVKAKLFIQSSTLDADLFLTLRAFSPNIKEVYFYDYYDPHMPLAHGWLRASHRKLDPELSTEWRPYHTHDEIQYLEPGKIYELDVEVWPTSVVLPPGYRIALTIRGKDWEYPGEPVRIGFNIVKGTGPFRHEGRPREIYDNIVRIYTSKKTPSYLLLPIIPPKDPQEEEEDNKKIEKLLKFKTI